MFLGLEGEAVEAGSGSAARSDVPGFPGGAATPAGAVVAFAALRLREALASPLFALSALFLAAFIYALPQLVLFGFGDEARIVREMAVATLRLGALLIALVFGAGAQARERERGALALVLARPVRPAAVVLGRYAGSLAALLIYLSMLSVALALALKSPAAAPAAARTALEGAALLAVAVFLGEALPAGAAAVATFLVFGLGHHEAGLGAASAALLPDLGAIGAAGGADVGAARAAALAAVAAAAYLALGAAVAEAREA